MEAPKSHTYPLLFVNRANCGELLFDLTAKSKGHKLELTPIVFVKNDFRAIYARPVARGELIADRR